MTEAHCYELKQLLRQRISLRKQNRPERRGYVHLDIPRLSMVAERSAPDQCGEHQNIPLRVSPLFGQDEAECVKPPKCRFTVVSVLEILLPVVRNVRAFGSTLYGLLLQQQKILQVGETCGKSVEI